MATFQATLQELRKRKYKTIKAFAEAYGCGPTKASGILNGHYHMTLSRSEVDHLAYVLGVNFVDCADACDNTFAQLKGYKGNDWKLTARTHKGIWARWMWENRLRLDAKEAAKTGNWEEYRRKYTFTYKQEQERTQSNPRPQERQADCFSILGISSLATPEQIKAAFRAKVKASHEQGHFTGDMDKLVTAKEQALKLVGSR